MRAEDFFGAPMAAPETATMRRLRFAFITLASLSAVGIVAIGGLTALLGRPGAGGLLLALIASAAITGLVFFRVKTRRDDCWIASRGFDRDGNGQ